MAHTAADYESYLEVNRAMFLLTRNRGQGDGRRPTARSGHLSPGRETGLFGRSDGAALRDTTRHCGLASPGTDRIRVNAAASTPIYHEFIAPAEVDQALAGFNNFHPIGWIGTSTDVEQASWVTDAIWDVDGGVMAGRNR